MSNMSMTKVKALQILREAEECYPAQGDDPEDIMEYRPKLLRINRAKLQHIVGQRDGGWDMQDVNFFGHQNRDVEGRTVGLFAAVAEKSFDIILAGTIEAKAETTYEAVKRMSQKGFDKLVALADREKAGIGLK